MELPQTLRRSSVTPDAPPSLALLPCGLRTRNEESGGHRRPRPRRRRPSSVCLGYRSSRQRNRSQKKERRRPTDRAQREADGGAVDNIMKIWGIGMQRMAEIEYVEEDAVLSPAYIDVTTMPLSHRLHDISNHIVMKIFNALIPNFQSPARPRRRRGTI